MPPRQAAETPEPRQRPMNANPPSVCSSSPRVGQHLRPHVGLEVRHGGETPIARLARHGHHRRLFVHTIGVSSYSSTATGWLSSSCRPCGHARSNTARCSPVTGSAKSKRTTPRGRSWASTQSFRVSSCSSSSSLVTPPSTVGAAGATAARASRQCRSPCSSSSMRCSSR